MLLGPIKLVTMNASRSQDGFVPGNALQQPVAPVPGLITFPLGKPGSCLRVQISLSLPHDLPTAFRFLARASGCNEASRDASIELTASWNGDGAEYLIGKVSVYLVPAFLQKRHFGKVFFQHKKD